jgi:hypothetical protein
MDVNFSSLLAKQVLHYLQHEFHNRALLYLAVSEYLKYHRPSAIKCMGANMLDHGMVMYETFKKSLPVEHQPLFFHYPVGLAWPVPFRNTSRSPDLIMVSGELDVDIYKGMLGDHADIKIIGFGKNSEIPGFKKQHDFRDSMKHLGISAVKRFNAFYVSSGVIRGFVSSGEHYALACLLIQYAMNHRDFHLIIKPHPSELVHVWKSILESHGNPQSVTLARQSINPYHCVNVCNLVITKFSTLAVEAMEFEKPVITVALDGERNFVDIFEDAVEKFYDTGSLVSRLNEITASPDKFEHWKKQRINIQNEYLPRKMLRPETSVEKNIADQLIKHIKIAR